MVKSKIVLYGYNFIVYIKIDDIYKNIAGDIETRFDISNYESERPKWQSNWINGRWIRQKNYDKICWIIRKNL